MILRSHAVLELIIGRGDGDLLVTKRYGTANVANRKRSTGTALPQFFFEEHSTISSPTNSWLLAASVRAY